MQDWEDSLHLPFGVGVIQHAAQVDMPQLIQCWRKSFVEQQILIEDRMDHSAIQFEADHIVYRGIEASKNRGTSQDSCPSAGGPNRQGT